MTKTTLTASACATLLWAGTALATPTAQQQCDYTRITAWKTYQGCVEGVVAKDAKGVQFDEFGAFARCRHAYFVKWAGFQGKSSLAGSTCIGPRFTEPVVTDGTVTDNLTTLVWEKQDLSGSIHDANNSYSLSTGPPYAEDGTAFTSFLATINSASGFAGSNGWRLPTLPELQTILLDFPCRGFRCSCPSDPCVDSSFGTTVSGSYWSVTSHISDPISAWPVEFSNGSVVGTLNKEAHMAVRAVRGGL